MVYRDIKATISDFNTFVLNERSDDFNVLVMSFNSLPDINLSKELKGETSQLKKLAQLSADQNCTVLCGIKMFLEDREYLSVAVAHHGKLIDIADRVVCSDIDVYECTNKLKIYNTSSGRIGLLIDSDAELRQLWQKIMPACDFLVCLCDSPRRQRVIKNSEVLNFPALYVDRKNKFWLFKGN